MLYTYMCDGILNQFCCQKSQRYYNSFAIFARNKESFFFERKTYRYAVSLAWTTFLTVTVFIFPSPHPWATEKTEAFFYLKRKSWWEHQLIKHTTTRACMFLCVPTNWTTWELVRAKFYLSSKKFSSSMNLLMKNL